MEIEDTTIQPWYRSLDLACVLFVSTHEAPITVEDLIHNADWRDDPEEELPQKIIVSTDEDPAVVVEFLGGKCWQGDTVIDVAPGLSGYDACMQLGLRYVGFAVDQEGWRELARIKEADERRCKEG